MASVNWNDDRLDDEFDEIRQESRTKAEAITYLSLEVNTLKSEMQNLRDRMHDKTTSKVNWWMISATFSNSLTAVVVYLISKGK